MLASDLIISVNSRDAVSSKYVRLTVLDGHTVPHEGTSAVEGMCMCHGHDVLVPTACQRDAVRYSRCRGLLFLRVPCSKSKALRTDIQFELMP